jgi:hypothetical protein
VNAINVSTACRERAGYAEPNTRPLAAGGTDLQDKNATRRITDFSLLLKKQDKQGITRIASSEVL